MIDAATSDLLPIIQTGSSTSSCDSSAENCKTNEDSGPQRCLSPVLNSNNSHRKLIYNRKRGRTKTRIKLTKRFSSPHDTNTEHDEIQKEIVSGSFSGYEDYINKALGDFQNLKSDQVEDRLAKIRQFEKEKRKFLDSLYVPNETKTYVSDRKPCVLDSFDEFNFKKPVSPISGAKKFKPSVDVLSQDRKTVLHGVTNFSEWHYKKQDLNNYTEPNEADMLENVRNENKNVKEGDLKFQGFCTGSGKNIIISPESLRKNVEIFGDILDINKVTPLDQNPNSCLDAHIATSRKENVFQQCTINEKTSLSCQAKEFAVYEETVDQLHNLKEFSFMQTSISDAQLILATDVALSMMDNNLLVAPSIDSSNIKNNCDVAVKLIFKENQGDKTIEHEMLELEKLIFSTNIESNPKMIGSSNTKNSNTKSDNDKKFTNSNKVERNNKNISPICGEENYFKGFATFEYNFAQQLYNNHSKFLEVMENVIECCSNWMVNENKEEKIVLLDTNQSNPNHKNGKHALDNMCMIPSKRFKFDYSKDDNFETDTFDCGFMTASKKPIKMLPSSVKNAQCIYEQICQTENTLDDGLVDTYKVDMSECGFKTASKKPIKMLPSSMKNAQHMYEQICKTKNPADWTDTITELKENMQLRDVSSGEFTNVQEKTSKSKEISQTLNNNITTAFKEAKFDVNSDEFSDCGFKTASKKLIKMLPSSLKKAQSIFENIDTAENEITEDTFLKKSGKTNLKNASPTGFSAASGKTIEISDNAWHKASSVFADEEMSSAPPIQNHEFDELILNNEPLGFNIKSPSTDKKISKISNVSRNLVPIEEEEDPTVCAAGFTTGSGTKIKISKSALQKSETLFADEDLSSNMKREEVKDMIDATTSDGLEKPNKVQHENHFLKQDNNEEQNLRSFPESHHGSVVSRNTNPANSKQTFRDSPIKATKIAKKRLGLSGCKQISIPNDKLQKAKLILEEDSDSNQSGGSRNVSFSTTPVRFKQAELHSSTPLKETSAFKNSDVGKIIKSNTLDNIDITPVKKPQFNENVETKNLVSENKNNSAIVIQECTENNIKKRSEQFNNEYEDLAYRMKVILERKKALVVQEQIIKNADDVHRRQKPGILSVQKKSPQRISLKELCGNRKPGSVYSANEALALDVPKQVLEVTPKNAKHVHFKCNWKNSGEKYSSTLSTADGAVVIPNAGDLIGLTEINTAFEAMPGVDPRLLPNEWISNHFKWIVWKLASLQNNFPDLFPDCLSVENVIQQLKYRYDREIDQAERPALRRILEKDDIPQKRMILCVSDIIEVSNNTFELELTDGWYCVQTFIDQPLCKQIVAAKIVIGTKLIVECAEILNCDGCHPLEVPSNVKLKINYNCTRRAAWHAKLGYQRTAEPFPIPLRTINPDGGTIAVVKMYIARAYPLRYMERQAGKIVWRNKKAEEKRAQEWSNARMKEMEMVHQKVQQDYEKEMNSTQKNMLGKIGCRKISEISSPKLLYEMLENTNDPEGFKNMMSSAQIASAMEYRSNMCAHHQQEVASRIEKQIKNLKSSNRDVIAVLKLRILDGSECSEGSFIFNIWKPTEEHLQALKEGCMFSVYNVFPKPNGDLAANSRTHFKPEIPLPSINNKIQRHVLPIGMVQHSVHKARFNEYDTVGTVVQMHKDIHYQDLWLTDSVGRLLHVNILEGPEQCCLLDNLKRGQGIAVMNLIFRRPHDTHGQAFANQCTTITGYPQHKFLQDGLTEHCTQVPKDLTSLLNKCEEKIEVCVANMHIARNTSSLYGSISASGNVADVFDDSSEDNTVIPSRLTTTDVAMSLIDTDQFL